MHVSLGIDSSLELLLASFDSPMLFFGAFMNEELKSILQISLYALSKSAHKMLVC